MGVVYSFLDGGPHNGCRSSELVMARGIERLLRDRVQAYMDELEKLTRFVRKNPFIVWVGFACLVAFTMLMLALFSTL